MDMGATPASNVKHDNTWMQYPGQAIGMILGNTIGAPFGGSFWGGPAGKSGGLLAGDLLGGNMKGAQADILNDPSIRLQQMIPGMSPLGPLGGLLGGGKGASPLGFLGGK